MAALTSPPGSCVGATAFRFLGPVYLRYLAKPSNCSDTLDKRSIVRIKNSASSREAQGSKSGRYCRMSPVAYSEVFSSSVERRRFGVVRAISDKGLPLLLGIIVRLLSR